MLSMVSIIQEATLKPLLMAMERSSADGRPPIWMWPMVLARQENTPKPGEKTRKGKIMCLYERGERERQTERERERERDRDRKTERERERGGGGAEREGQRNRQTCSRVNNTVKLVKKSEKDKRQIIYIKTFTKILVNSLKTFPFLSPGHPHLTVKRLCLEIWCVENRKYKKKKNASI